MTTAYDAELAAADADIAALSAVTPDAATATRLVFRHYHRAALTGRLDDAETAERAADDAIGWLGPAEDLCLLKAELAVKGHRLDDALAALALAPGLAERPAAWGVRIDVDVQRGRHDDALALARAAVDATGDWSARARLAHVLAVGGDVAAADALYAAAQEGLTAKEMRAYAWLEVQRGALLLGAGDAAVAAVRFARADAAYSGYWYVQSHVAKALTALGRHAEAAERYRDLVARTGLPELAHALGDAYARLGRDGDARHWREQARAAYVAAAARGVVQYDHHLADLDPALSGSG